MPYKDILASLVQRLVQQVGLQAALDLMRAIPELAVDSEGNVLEYNRDDPWSTARLLSERIKVGDTPVVSSAQAGPHGLAMEIGTSTQLEAGSMPTRPIRMLIIDDHVLVREGLVSLIDPQPDMHVVGQAGSVREAVALARSTQPDVILMDFTLPDGTGAEATREILAVLPNTKIVFLTVHDDDERLFAAISAGAIGYLLKSVRSAELLSWVRGVVRGDVALSPSIGQRVLGKLSRLATQPTAPSTTEELTEREIEILRLLVQGHTNRRIADVLKLSVRTVEYHRANLTSKLNMHSRADLVRYALEHGLLDKKDLEVKPDIGRPIKR